jgi:hypothetical protein
MRLLNQRPSCMHHLQIIKEHVDRAFIADVNIHVTALLGKDRRQIRKVVLGSRRIVHRTDTAFHEPELLVEKDTIDKRPRPRRIARRIVMIGIGQKSRQRRRDIAYSVKPRAGMTTCSRW